MCFSVDILSRENPMQSDGIRSEDERSGKNGTGVNPCAKIEMPAHGTMSQGLVYIWLWPIQQ